MIRVVRSLVAVVAAAFVAVGCAVAADDGKVIFPAGSPGVSAPAVPAGGGLGVTSVVGILVLAGAGGWLLWRGRKVNSGGRDARLLEVTETRSLGNRQYLVVASYDGKSFLLGVCPGRIDLLAPLSDSAAPRKTL